jgi:hypothetical protein
MKDLAAALRPLGLVPYVEWATREGVAGFGLDTPDFVDAEGGLVVEAKDSQGGARDLRAGVAQLALQAREHPDARCVLLVVRTRMSAGGVRAEWERLQAVLAPEIAARLGIVVVLDEDAVVIPDDPVLRRVAERAATVGTQPKRARVDRSYEVMRVLMARWLLKRGRIAIGELGRQAGLSHPSVSEALAALGDAVERTPDRSTILRLLPREQWAQLLALAPTIRQTKAFVDESGRGGDPQRLLDRLARLRTAGVAVGGVVAARHWHPALDLHGLPRLDVTVHAPEGRMDTSFVERLDPALVPAPAGAPPLLVLHALPRAESLFTEDSEGGLPIADPVEVLLDLHELRLVEQSDALLRHMRRSA